MEVKNYFRQVCVSSLIRYDKYEDTLRPLSNALRLISGKNIIGTVIENARVARALGIDLFILLFRYYGIVWNACLGNQTSLANPNIMLARSVPMSASRLLAPSNLRNQ